MGPAVIVDIQFNQGAAEWSRMRELVLAAEEAGFGTVWNLDHFSGALFENASMNECFTSLGAWAAVTTRIGLGSLVANVANRSAGLLALGVATVQDISGGRFTLGVGAGAAPGSRWGREQETLGMELLPTMAARHERLAEVVADVREILSPDRDAKYEGFPVLTRPVPTIVGVNSEALARYAGRECDGVNVGWWSPGRAGFVRAAREAAGEREFDCSVWDFFTPENCDPAHPSNVAFRGEGLDHVILLVRGAPEPEVIASCARYLK